MLKIIAKSKEKKTFYVENLKEFNEKYSSEWEICRWETLTEESMNSSSKCNNSTKYSASYD